MLNLDPVVLSIPNGVRGDVRDMPFADKQFSVSLIEHVAEHLGSIEDYQQALAEATRVADACVVIVPSPDTFHNQVNPQHRLDIEVHGRRALVRERRSGREAWL